MEHVPAYPAFRSASLPSHTVLALSTTPDSAVFRRDSDCMLSEGPITPETHAQDPAKLAEVPEFGEGEKIGTAMLPDVQKGRSLPMFTTNVPLAIAVVQ